MKNSVKTLLLLIAISNCAIANVPTYQRLSMQGHQIDLLTIDPKVYDFVQVKANDNSRKTVRAHVEEHHAYAGINGGFFDYTDEQKTKAKAIAALKIAGEWVNYPSFRKGALGWNSVAQKPHFDEFDPEHLKTSWQQFDYVVGGIPLLIKNKKVNSDYRQDKMTKSFIEERHARTAVCIKPDGKWLWLVASHTKAPDRSQVKKIIEGLTLKELTDVLLQQGCIDALNLDGGGSSTLVIDNKVINLPAGDFNPVTHSYEERPIYDAMIIKRKVSTR